jgi:hypothetical protein
MVLFEGELFADYHQFYLADAVSEPDLPTQWSDEALRRRVLASDGVLVVSTARNVSVPVRVELHDTRPTIDLSLTDHAVETTLRTSGEIVIAGLTDYLPDAAWAKVPAGELRALAISTGIGTLSKNGLKGDDRYVIHLWLAGGADVVVHRQWDGN